MAVLDEQAMKQETLLVSGLGCETLSLIKTGRSEGKEPEDIRLDLFYFLTVVHYILCCSL